MFKFYFEMLVFLIGRETREMVGSQIIKINLYNMQDIERFSCPGNCYRNVGTFLLFR